MQPKAHRVDFFKEYVKFNNATRARHFWRYGVRCLIPTMNVKKNKKQMIMEYSQSLWKMRMSTMKLTKLITQMTGTLSRMTVMMIS